MDDPLFLRLLDDKSLFSPTGSHRVIEICNPHGSPQDSQIREMVLQEKQLVAWCRDPKLRDEEGFLFRLLICSPRVLDRDIWPLPVTSSGLAGMMKSLEIPTLFPRAICRHIPLATSFDTLESVGKFGILLRTNLSHTWQYALALQYDPITQTTTGILFGLRANEVDEILQSIRVQSQYISCPSVLPCILMDKALDAIVKDAEERRKSLTQIRIKTGSAGFRRASVKHPRWDDRDGLDLDVLMQKLTSLSDACAGINAVCSMQKSFVETVSAFQVRAEVAVDEAAHPPDSLASLYARQQLRFFSQFLLGVESKVAYTKSSVRDQVRTIHTLIAQRDSRSHIDLARTMRRLAELSRRDSSDMRVIATVTLLFLPATFVSTFFSASFFNFLPDTGRVSRWVWVYFVVATLLTGIVMGGWWFFARRQQKQDRKSISEEGRGIQPATEEVTATELEETQAPFGKMDDFRPYLGGSIVEGMFARKVSMAVPFQGPKRIESGSISPTATGIR